MCTVGAFMKTWSAGAFATTASFPWLNRESAALMGVGKERRSRSQLTSNTGEKRST